jgi:endonuclease YncB( thermonuclease family)
MRYAIELFDVWNRRLAVFDEVPLIEATRGTPDEPSIVRGLLPRSVTALGQAYRVCVRIEDAVFCEGRIHWTGPQWSDARKLILDRYVPFQEIIAFEAKSDPESLNPRVSAAYTNRTPAALVRDVLNRALGPLHYWVDHTAYPDGAQREHAKFDARRTPENELEVGGIAEGQWVDASRIDATAAYAKDGDTIAGLVVDGDPWPDLRLMLLDAEETARNSHAISRHPEVALWSDAQYNRSGYKRKGDAAKAFLQSLLDTKGIGYIELNPHRNPAGVFDDRVDAYGRYLGLIFGGGECFNAAVVEQGLADVYLYDGGRYHDPELALKDFFSYTGVHHDSITATGGILEEFDVSGGALEAIAAAAYATPGVVFQVDEELGVTFALAGTVDRVICFDPLRMGVAFGEASNTLANVLFIEGNPITAAVNHTYTRGESIDTYGKAYRRLEYFSLSIEADAARLALGLLEDLAYPAPTGSITFYRGESGLNVGDCIELREGPVRRLAPALPGAWGGRFPGKLAARVCRVRHRFSGRHVETTVDLDSPLRSIGDPLAWLVRSQPAASTLFEFRLDAETVGLDMGFHLG